MKKQKIYLLMMVGILIWNCLFFFKQSLVNAQISVNQNLNFNHHSPSFLIANDSLPDQTNQTNEETADADQFQDFTSVTEKTTKLEGVFNLYQNQKDNLIYLEIKPDQLEQDFLWATTLASGIGDSFLINGMPINDFLFRFKRVQNKIEINLPNLYFRDQTGLPLPNSLANSFSDSTIYSVPITSINPQTQGILINLGEILFNGKNVSLITEILPYILGGNYTPISDQATLGKVKVFPDNLEIDIRHPFTSIDSFLDVAVLPDSNNFNLTIHYSIIPVPNHNYRPRLADDRIGYFITAYQDLSNQQNQDSFVRYIERWNLEPSDPNAILSPPKQPIVFWLDNAIPEEYRDTVAQGIKVWNKAFEKIGFQDAIEVKQMPDQADWDPADSRYNTIIWSAMFQSGLLGVGPSHVNPLTGEILDADVIINSDVIRFAMQEYDNLSQFSGDNKSINLCQQFYQKMGGINFLNLADYPVKFNESKPQSLPPLLSKLMAKQDYCYGLGSTAQFQRGSLAMSLLNYIPSTSEAMKTYTKQFLFDLISHEVGHTLGLRHNFHGSTLRNTEELNNIELTRNHGSVGSVMDYTAVNLAPPGMIQGDYYPTTIGPYDQWAIEYGYKPSGKRFPPQERPFLNQIAQRAPEPELAYATDEDLWNFDDPQVNIYDLSGDILNHAIGQMENANLMMEKLGNYTPGKNENYNNIRRKFNQIFSYYLSQIDVTQKYIGGRSFNRDHPRDPNGRQPFETVSLAQQRQALQILDQYLFSEDAFNFPSTLFNRLAPSRWNHWGQQPSYGNLDYPVYDLISWFQGDMLKWLLSDYRLSQLKNIEIKSGNSEFLSLSELFSNLETTIWREILEPNPEKLNFKSLRRTLQREHLNVLIGMILRQSNPPEDARSIAWYELGQIKSKINDYLNKYESKLDLETKAHLAESSDRIEKSLVAPIQSR